MENRQLSKNFDLSEFLESDTATKLGINNTNPPADVVKNIESLVAKVLQPLRNLYGKPMIINSGWRCEALNKAVGGVESSQHRKGMAADVRCENPEGLYSLLKSSGLPFDQCGVYRTFCHISHNPNGNNRRMRFNGGY